MPMFGNMRREGGHLNNGGLLHKLCLLDQEPGLLGVLLGNLLLLDSSCELPERYNVSLDRLDFFKCQNQIT